MTHGDQRLMTRSDAIAIVAACFVSLPRQESRPNGFADDGG
jgi:hypothetical protein